MATAWDTYAELEPLVTAVIKEKRQYVQEYFSKLQRLSSETEAYLQEIQSFPESYEQ